MSSLESCSPRNDRQAFNLPPPLVRTAQVPFAPGFVINRNSRAYTGPLTDAEVALTLASAYGDWGSGADYLYNTVHNLTQHSIHDRHLWRLQEMVAEVISNRDLASCDYSDRDVLGSKRPVDWLPGAEFYPMVCHVAGSARSQ